MGDRGQVRLFITVWGIRVSYYYSVGDRGELTLLFEG